jgi:hypothetical protein
MLDSRLWAPVADPDQHLPVFIHRHTLGSDEFSFEVIQILAIQVKATFQRSIGHPAALL